MELKQFITGERFQGLADISFIPVGNGVGESECDFVKTQQKNNNYKSHYYNENTTVLGLDNVKTIFVNTWTLHRFFNVVFPQLPGKYNFISHNSDMGLTEVYRDFINCDKVIKWYSQNKDINHPKAFSLPIGLGNQQYSHGNLELLNSIIAKNFSKENVVFKNFNIQTNGYKRSIIDFITHRNGIVMSSPSSQEEYFNSIAKSMFCISPPGNGVDCHRIWECLYLKTIPVVEYNEAFREFKHLPILFITDWSTVTMEFLMSKVYMLRQFDEPINELTLDYWRNKIL